MEDLSLTLNKCLWCFGISACDLREKKGLFPQKEKNLLRIAAINPSGGGPFVIASGGMGRAPAIVTAY